MILLDTNIISEILKPEYDGNVGRWLETNEPGNLFLSSITIAELAFGVSRLPEGKRKTNLSYSVQRLESETFMGRILDFTVVAARRSGDIRAIRERTGRSVSLADAGIAATAITHSFALATRNIKDFEGLDLELVNPFKSQP
jgi:toxin FitB